MNIFKKARPQFPFIKNHKISGTIQEKHKNGRTVLITLMEPVIIGKYIPAGKFKNVR